MADDQQLYNTISTSGPLFDNMGLAPIITTGDAFIRVGLLWDSEDETTLQGRFKDVNGRWSSWYTVMMTWSEGTARVGHLDVAGAAARSFQLRLASGPEPDYLMAESIERLGEERVPYSLERPEHASRFLPNNLVRPRDEWDARNAINALTLHDPAKITIHHTNTPSFEEETKEPQVRLRQIQNYEMNTKGFADIGYHFVIDKNAEIWQGRAENYVGSHIKTHNLANIGIVFMGTYNDQTQPTTSQIQKVKLLLDSLIKSYPNLWPLSRNNLLGHRDYRNQEPGDCPGDNLYSQIPYLYGSTSN